MVAAVEAERADYAACVLGLRDYVNKNGFPGVVLGLSGGVDSALCAAMAVDALGAERVRCVMMPYKFTAQESLDDAAACAKALGVSYQILPIAPAVEGLEAALAPAFTGLPRDVTEENLQARARGTILMAISNKFNVMVVTTGNKSEMSVGYATLYGDMNGGFNPIKDLYKTEVFRLSRLRNGWKPEGAMGPDGPVIPENIITRPPTAELRENQKDEDSLPPYAVLDPILERLVEREEPISTIVAAGFDRGDRGARRAHAQHRRIQAPAGGAGREGDVEEFRPRPPLSDHQPLPRSRHAAAGAGRVAGYRQAGKGRGGRFLVSEPGRNVGPTVRTVRLVRSVSPGASTIAAGVCGASRSRSGRIGLPSAPIRGCDSRLAFCSVTTTSPGATVSSGPFSLERLGPAFARPAATAGRIERLAVTETRSATRCRAGR